MDYRVRTELTLERGAYRIKQEINYLGKSEQTTSAITK